ncbi:hypothetical protein [Acetobacter persici]|uniref:hypothetical protein n=1 Tax=Acetobacter persici TaxID=1076596 RepID=UPI001F3A58A2|nr:hypothetical protein [Acetobacter persici]MCG0998922.1 hypothetical protein [Acetobacter persici]
MMAVLGTIGLCLVVCLVGGLLVGLWVAVTDKHVKKVHLTPQQKRDREEWRRHKDLLNAAYYSSVRR